MARVFTNSASEYLQGTSPVSSGNCSIACWFNANNITTRYALMALNDNASNTTNHYLRIDGNVAGDPVLMISRDGGTERSASSSSGYSASTWHHALGVHAGTARYVYLDGGSKGTDNNTSSPTGLDDITIGAYEGTALFFAFDGSLAEVAVWNSTLTDADALILAAGYSPLFVQPSSLVFYDPLIRGVDSDGGGNSADWVAGTTTTENGTDIEATAHPRMIYPTRPSIITAPAAGEEPTTNYLVSKLALMGVGI